MGPTTSLEVALGLLRNADGSPPELIAVGRPPAFLLPEDRRVAAAMCTAHNGLRSPRRQATRVLTAALVRVGLGPVIGSRVEDHQLVDGGPLVAPGALVEELSQRLGIRVRLGVGLGTLDPYWKPVLQLFDQNGRDVAFAKVGWTELTRELVRTEAEVLATLDGGHGAVITPRLLHWFTCGELQVAVTEPLPRGARRLSPDALEPPPDALVALGDTGSERLTDATWWQEVRRRVTAGAQQAGAAGLEQLIDGVEDRLADHELAMGLQHGDWVPWNLARLAGDTRPVVWDWEYGRRSGPVGLDVVHGRYQSERLLRGRPADEAFATAHLTTTDALAMLHAAMVASRRCWVATVGHSRTDHGDDELPAAVASLERRLGAGPGR